MKKKIKILDIEIEYNNKNVRILNPRKAKSKNKMKAILNLFLMETNYKSCRSVKSWIKEWKAHNRLYKLGLFKEHTVDCDLEENEKPHRLIAYHILGI